METAPETTKQTNKSKALPRGILLTIAAILAGIAIWFAIINSYLMSFGVLTYGFTSGFFAAAGILFPRIRQEKRPDRTNPTLTNSVVPSLRRQRSG